MSKYYQPSGTVSERGGPMVRYHISSFDGSKQPYAIYVPNAYSPERKWPLVISLHGFSSDHVLNLRRVFGLGNAPGEEDAACKQCFPTFPEVGFVVASPYGFGSVGYAGAAEVDVFDVLEDVRRNYSIDDDRVYLTGLSMGGEGTWHLAVRFPHLWAAVAPVCAPTSVFIGPEDVRCFAGNIQRMPVHISHGDSDTVVPPASSREMVQLLREVGAQVEYEEYPGVGHNAWDHTYANARIFDWFSQFTRSTDPAKVKFVTDRLRYGRVQWMEITGLEDWEGMGQVWAEIDGQRVTVGSENVNSIAIHVRDTSMDPSEPVEVIWNAEEVFYCEPPSDGVIRIEQEEPFGPIAKRKGLEGPVFDAFHSRYAVVYGTQTGDPEELTSLQCLALQAAFLTDWADIEIPVIADKDVTEEQIRDLNLILVGDDRTNSLIARVNGDLPIRFTADGVQAGERVFTGDVGFVEIYPNPLAKNRYAVILGGRTEEIISKVSVRIFRDMPDYAVYTAHTDISKPETYLAYGYFTGGWLLP